LKPRTVPGLDTKKLLGKKLALGAAVSKLALLPAAPT